MANKKTMTSSDAKRIQAHADQAGTNQDFKARAQAAAAKNTQSTGGNASGTAGKK